MVLQAAGYSRSSGAVLNEFHEGTYGITPCRMSRRAYRGRNGEAATQLCETKTLTTRRIFRMGHCTRYLAPLYAVIAAFFLGRLWYSPFSWACAPVPEQIILTPGDDAPTPPFGPSANLVLYEGRARRRLS